MSATLFVQILALAAWVSILVAGLISHWKDSK